MRVLILGGDGYLGWPTALAFASRRHDVWVVDNYLRRRLAQQVRSEPLIETPRLDERTAIFEALSGYPITVHIGDCTDHVFLSDVVYRFKPDTIIHYAELPSAPYSMIGPIEARTTLENNLRGTFNVIWAILEHAPECHLIKLGTMGEYGTPNIDIEEGWIDIEHKGRRQRFLYPRQGGSLYHTTKILDTDLLWFYVRAYGLRVTDLMQGPVYGLSTTEVEMDPRLWPNFHYDDIFGTVVNRFIVQAVAGIPLTVYGTGNQTRGFLNLKDTLQCVELAAATPPAPGELRILNQFTELFSINQLAAKVKLAADRIGIAVTIRHLPNPRLELEQHYYNARNTGLLELGLKPNLMSEAILVEMLEAVREYRDSIDCSKIMPRVRWAAKTREL
jgi:UDP-sulfoquinovose synthase